MDRKNSWQVLTHHKREADYVQIAVAIKGQYHAMQNEGIEDQIC